MTGTFIIYLKELKDILRDRRTIISMVLIPILFYPVISIGLGKVISSQIEKTRAERQPVMILPIDGDPAFVASLETDKSLRVVDPDTIRTKLLNIAETDSTLDPGMIRRVFSGSPREIPDSLKETIYYAAVSREWISAVVELPVDITARIAAGDSLAIGIYTDEADVHSEAAGDHIRDWGLAFRDSVVDLRLGAAGIDRATLKPFWLYSVDIAPAAKQSGRFLAMILPYMLMILTFTGGLYPALDITAGEKERHTLETLLVAPVARWQIAVGKFLAVMTAGFVTMLLATLSMTFSMKLGMSQFSDGGQSALQVGMTGESVAWLLLLMVPMSTLFASMLVTVAISARSFKEAQSYTTPLLMSIILPAMITFVPGIKLNWGLTAVPVVNLCLALKDVLMGVHDPAMILAVFGFTTLYAVLMLFIATRIFQRESVLFRT